ncbi:hypothetical protein Tco_1113974 [Tanacetum coccineum]|uniref:Uncharacterized protein n=1 Tax=Tanacetum coccineum TaxID=301880 RepID=A0ABQ5IUV3_9ASTR
MQKYTIFDAQSFKDAMIYNMDSIGKYMLEIILHQQWTPQLLKQKKLMQTQEDHSNPIQALNIDSLKVDLVFIQNTCSVEEDRTSERLQPVNQTGNAAWILQQKIYMQSNTRCQKQKKDAWHIFDLFIHTFKFFLKKT